MATAYAEYDRLINNSGTTEPTAPKAPANMKASAGDAQVTLSWSKATGADSYTVKRSTTSGGPYTTVATVTDSTYKDTGVVNETTYYYVASATNYLGTSPDSAEVSAKPIDATKTSYTDWDKTPLYVNDQRVWGLEP